MSLSPAAFFSTLLMAGALHASMLTFDNQPVPVIDPQRFAGRWYSLTSIPTAFDRDWLESTDNYTPRPGGFEVRTTYRHAGDLHKREISSRLFTPGHGPQGDIKAQFWWPFRVPYTIIKLAPDYSWMVGGSPDRKMLFILSRHPSLPPKLLEEIVQRCRELGYPTDRLKSQEHRAF